MRDVCALATGRAVPLALQILSFCTNVSSNANCSIIVAMHASVAGTARPTTCWLTASALAIGQSDAPLLEQLRELVVRARLLTAEPIRRDDGVDNRLEAHHRSLSPTPRERKIALHERRLGAQRAAGPCPRPACLRCVRGARHARRHSPASWVRNAAPARECREASERAREKEEV